MKSLTFFFIALFLCISTPFAQCERTTVVYNYQNVYLPATINSTTLGWTGSVSTCDPGTIADIAHTYTLQRINYFRELVGLPGNITFDAALSSKAQEAALVIDANNSLSHYPPETWLCWTQNAYDACGKSNIYWNLHSTSAITGYIQDPGTGNTACGHRRWILYSRASVFGHGSTTGANALWVIGNTTTAPAGLEYVAYPSPGYFPAPLVFARWSFSKPSADFSSTTIEMYDNNMDPVSLAVNAIANGYGDSTIVWEPVGVITSSSTDLTYTVTLNNVVTGGTPENFTYEVTIIQPTELVCEEGYVWSEARCTCVRDSSLLITSTPPEVGVKDASLIRDLDMNITPNPFNPATIITLAVSANGPFTVLSVHTIDGKTIREWRINDHGYQQIGWNGRDNTGKTVGAGMYMVTVRQGGRRVMKKVLLLK